ncbi:hypothetical protein BCR33DRAFT_719541 [Rhizoclosmatium globosum]|uniref:Amino acid transporter transmembrane domain-containing protein n=1 Tax=Rhizoclosmatium globosum TaxID=329046 RepID=A0A1Y2BZI0_9FUNG|nr:hypothetical protein BCR33DRAFT_719541 [Rhizoclosmatium globosum]|eukprot:ORY40136.1 hypothetical protein BCR33DRAFT_719541 [Rhizoclosmatium globosum]
MTKDLASPSKERFSTASSPPTSSSEVGRKTELSAFGREEKEQYLEKATSSVCKLFHVWGFVVGAVISGEFSAFNVAYQYGLGSMIVAHVFTSLLMITVSLTLTELRQRCLLRSASYANAAFHGSVACIIGYAYTFDMIFIGAEVTNFVGVAFQTLFATDAKYNVLYWIASVAVCSIINLSPKATLNTLVVLTTLSCLLVIIPFFAVARNFDFSTVFQTSITMPDGTTGISTDFLPFGLQGVVSMPCCVEETTEIGKNVPRGMLAANLTLLLLSWIALLVTAGMPPGISSLEFAIFPFNNIFGTVFQLSNQEAVSLISIPSVLASQLAIYYACARYIYGMSRGGYMPPPLSLTTKNGAPVLDCDSFILQYSPDPNTLTIINSAGTIFAMTAYIIHPLVYIRLNIKLPTLPRPFKHILAMVPLYITIGYIALLPVYYFYIQKLLEDSPENCLKLASGKTSARVETNQISTK